MSGRQLFERRLYCRTFEPTYFRFWPIADNCKHNLSREIVMPI